MSRTRFVGCRLGVEGSRRETSRNLAPDPDPGGDPNHHRLGDRRRGKRSASLLLLCLLAAPVLLLPAADLTPDDLHEELERTERELADLQSRYRDRHPDVVDAQRRVVELRQALEAAHPQATPVPGEMGTLRRQLWRLLQRYTERHPDVAAVRRQIEALETGVPLAPASDFFGFRRNEDRPEILRQVPGEIPQDTPGAIPQEPRRELPYPGPSPSPVPEIPTPIPPLRSGTAARGADFYPGDRLRLPVTVKEVAGAGAARHPITLVVPLPYGRYRETSAFRMTDAEGKEVPAQFGALERWWARDKSIRHLEVDFQPTVDAFAPSEDGHGAAAGSAIYYLSDDGPADAVASPLRVIDAPDRLEVETGPLRFALNKRRFRVFDEVWRDADADGRFEDDELVLRADDGTGFALLGRRDDDSQRDSDRDDLGVTVEKSGPLRAVVKVQAPTRYAGPEDHLHGFALRIYAYAGKPFVKIDYQLQNSDKGPVYAGPLYFRSLALDLPLLLEGEPEVRIGLGDETPFQGPRGDGIALAQESHDAAVVREGAAGGPSASGRTADGFLDVRDKGRGVTAFIRYFWETWPNGLAIDATNRLSLALFPDFGAQWHQNHVSPTGLYWLQDMQHLHKEALLSFHDGEKTIDTLRREAALFAHPPVATLPTEWYALTRATLDLGGVVPPLGSDAAGTDRRYRYQARDSEAGADYRLNGALFYLIDPKRRSRPATAGGWAYGRARYVLSENPADVQLLRILALGELNARPHWMAGYSYADDFPRTRLGERLPWQARSWRRGGKPGGEYLADTGPSARPRDDAHGWYYHVREAYYATADPWIADWYGFIGEYRKAFLAKDFDHASRAIGHALASAVDAYRVTGDTEILTHAHRAIAERLRKEQDSRYGYRNSLCCGKHGEAAFQAGYLARAVIDFMEEVEPSSQAHADAFQFLSGLMEWNLHFARFSNYLDPRGGDLGKSHGSALTFVDPQAWYYWHTGRKVYWDQIEDYLDGGIDGGRSPFGNLGGWNGQFEGRFYQWVKQGIRPDAAPPAPIRDLALVEEDGDRFLRFEAPRGAVRYQVVWGDKPIVEGPSADPKELNWWAAHAIPLAAAAGGARERIAMPGEAEFAAVFSFDAADNMSAISNLAAVGGASEAPLLPDPAIRSESAPPRAPAEGEPPPGACASGYPDNEWPESHRGPEVVSGPDEASIPGFTMERFAFAYPKGSFLDGDRTSCMTHNISQMKKAHGRLYFVDNIMCTVNVIDGDRMYRIAGTGLPGDRDGPAETAEFYFGVYVEGMPDLAVAPNGDIYVSDNRNGKVKRIHRLADGRWWVETVAGGGSRRDLPVGDFARADEVDLDKVGDIELRGRRKDHVRISVGHLSDDPEYLLYPDGRIQCVRRGGEGADVVLDGERPDSVRYRWATVGRGTTVLQKVWRRDGRREVVAGIPAPGARKPVDGPVDDATFWWTWGLMRPDGRAAYTIGGDEWSIRRVMNGRVMTLDTKTGTWIESRDRRLNRPGGGADFFHIDADGTAYMRIGFKTHTLMRLPLFVPDGAKACR